MGTSGLIEMIILLSACVASVLLGAELIGYWIYLDTGRIPYLTDGFLCFIRGFLKKMKEVWKSIIPRRSKDLPPLPEKKLPAIDFVVTWHLSTLVVLVVLAILSPLNILHRNSSGLAPVIFVFGGGTVLSVIVLIIIKHIYLIDNRDNNWWLANDITETLTPATGTWYGPWKAARLVCLSAKTSHTIPICNACDVTGGTHKQCMGTFHFVFRPKRPNATTVGAYLKRYADLLKLRRRSCEWHFSSVPPLLAPYREPTSLDGISYRDTFQNPAGFDVIMTLN